MIFLKETKGDSNLPCFVKQGTCTENNTISCYCVSYLDLLFCKYCKDLFTGIAITEGFYECKYFVFNISMTVFSVAIYWVLEKGENQRKDDAGAFLYTIYVYIVWIGWLYCVIYIFVKVLLLLNLLGRVILFLFDVKHSVRNNIFLLLCFVLYIQHGAIAHCSVFKQRINIVMYEFLWIMYKFL